MKPPVIYDPEDLNQHDRAALIIDGREDIGTVGDLADHINAYPYLYEMLFPAVIIATGDQMRAVYEALEDSWLRNIKP